MGLTKLRNIEPNLRRVLVSLHPTPPNFRGQSRMVVLIPRTTKRSAPGQGAAPQQPCPPSGTHLDRDVSPSRKSQQYFLNLIEYASSPMKQEEISVGEVGKHILNRDQTF